MNREAIQKVNRATFGRQKREQHPGWLAKARKKSSRAPEYRGSLKIGEQEYWLSGWESTDKFGRPILSLRATPRPKESEK